MEQGVTKKKKSRPRPLPPDVTSRNLAIEKRRRSEMNQRFLNLARCVPALAPVTRLSKTLIVDKSVQYLQQQNAICSDAGRDLRCLLNTHNNLIAEVNKLYALLQIPSRLSPAIPTSAMVSLMEAEKNVYGDFPDGLGRLNTCTPLEPRLPARSAESSSSPLDLPAMSDHAICGQTGSQEIPMTFPYVGHDVRDSGTEPSCIILDAAHEAMWAGDDREQHLQQIGSSNDCRLESVAAVNSTNINELEYQEQMAEEDDLDLSHYVNDQDIDFCPSDGNAVESFSTFWDGSLGRC